MKRICIRVQVLFKSEDNVEQRKQTVPEYSLFPGLTVQNSCDAIYIFFLLPSVANRLKDTPSTETLHRHDTLYDLLFRSLLHKCDMF